MKKISVIIPTFKDWNGTLDCLNALSKQTLHSSLFEIILIDNDNLSDPPSKLNDFKNLKYLKEDKEGSYAARNKGVFVSTSNLIAFIDSDCIPDTNWLEVAVANFAKNENIHRLAGRVKIFHKNKKPNLFEKNDLIFAFNQQKNVLKGSSVTANLVVQKGLFEKVGYFNCKLKSGGDYEWNIRCSRLGFNIEYNDQLIVHHPARSSWDSLYKKEKRVAGGKAIQIQKELSFLKILNLLYEARPSFFEIKIMKSSDLKLTKFEIFQLFCLRSSLRIVRLFEIFRVLFGKKPERS